MTTKQEKQAAAVASVREATLARISLNSDTKSLDLKEGDDLYSAHLPEGLTPEIVKAVHDHDTTFVAGVASAFVDVTTKGFKADKDLSQVNAEFGMFGKNKVQLMASRESGLTVGVVTTVTNSKAGPLKQAFADFNAAMDEAEDK